MKICSLYSGSSGNSILVSSDKTSVLIDVGLPGKKIDEALKEINHDIKNIKAIFITHEHIDHIKGAGVLSRKYDIPIYATEKTWNVMKSKLGNLKSENINIMNRRSRVNIDDLEVESFNIPHDAIAPVAYNIYKNSKKISIATDFGIFTQEIRDNIKDSQIIFLESNYEKSMLEMGPYPYELKRRILSENGHLSNEDCAKAILHILKYGLGKKIILGHLSNTNNHPDVAYATITSILKSNGVKIGEDVILSMANRYSPSSVVSI